MWNRFTHNILTIDSHVCRLAQMRPRVAQKTFGHKLNFPLTWFLWATVPVTYSCWLSQMRLIIKRFELILSGSRKTTAAAVRICQNICPNLCDCCYQLSACQLLTVVNQHSSTICDLSIGCVLLTCSSYVFICKVCILQYVWFPIWAHWHCRMMKVKYILDILCFLFGCPLNNKTLRYWCVKVKYHQIYDHICEQAW